MFLGLWRMSESSLKLIIEEKDTDLHKQKTKWGVEDNLHKLQIIFSTLILVDDINKSKDIIIKNTNFSSTLELPHSFT